MEGEEKGGKVDGKKRVEEIKTEIELRKSEEDPELEKAGKDGKGKRFVMYMYQRLLINVIFTYCRHILIKKGKSYWKDWEA